MYAVDEHLWHGGRPRYGTQCRIRVVAIEYQLLEANTRIVQ